MSKDFVVRYHKGYDCFFSDPGDTKSMKCRVCGVECVVERNVNGAHDYFYCPNSEKQWHDRALRLLMESEKFESRTLRDLVYDEYKDFLLAWGVLAPK